MNEKMIDEITAELQMVILTLDKLKDVVIELQRNNNEMMTIIDSIKLIQKGDSNEGTV